MTGILTVSECSLTERLIQTDVSEPEVSKVSSQCSTEDQPTLVVGLCLYCCRGGENKTLLLGENQRTQVKKCNVAVIS